MSRAVDRMKSKNDVTRAEVYGDGLSTGADALSFLANAGAEQMKKASAAKANAEGNAAIADAAAKRKEAYMRAAEADADPTNAAKQAAKATAEAKAQEAEKKAAYYTGAPMPGTIPPGMMPQGEDFLTKYKTPLIVGGVAVGGLLLWKLVRR